MKMENQFWYLEYHHTNQAKDEDYIWYKKNKELHYDLDKKEWVKEHEYTGCWYPAAFPCRSYTAAKRHLRKHDEIPRGSKFRLVSKFIGFDRYLVKK